jgi:hypothetical protein
LSLLKDEGITHLFGNPGTTELPLPTAFPAHRVASSPATFMWRPVSAMRWVRSTTHNSPARR